MNLNELIAECERLDKEATPGPWVSCYRNDSFDGMYQVMQETDKGLYAINGQHGDSSRGDANMVSRSRTLLPLLVKVIKNQQRQIGQLYKQAVGDLSEVNQLSAELEDIK